MRSPAGRAILDYLVLSFGLGLLAAICLAWTLFAVVLCRVLPERFGRVLGRRTIMEGFHLYLGALAATRAFRFDLSELDALRTEKSLIIAPNHPSLLDAVMILSRLPDVGCIMKAALMDNVLFGAGARLARYIRNDTGHGMIKRAVRELAGGSHLLLFPEGTRTTRPPVNACKGSVALIANRAGAMVQTVLIETDSEFLGKHWPLFRRPAFPIAYRVRLGRRFPPPADVRDFTGELERYFAETLGQAPGMRPGPPRLQPESDHAIVPRHESPLLHPPGSDPEL